MCLLLLLVVFENVLGSKSDFFRFGGDVSINDGGGSGLDEHGHSHGGGEGDKGRNHHRR